jgi:hypothetical protein
MTNEMLERAGERLLASGLDPLNSLLFSIAIEDRREQGEFEILHKHSKPEVIK